MKEIGDDRGSLCQQCGDTDTALCVQHTTILTAPGTRKTMAHKLFPAPLRSQHRHNPTFQPVLASRHKQVCLFMFFTLRTAEICRNRPTLISLTVLHEA